MEAYQINLINWSTIILSTNFCPSHIMFLHEKKTFVTFEIEKRENEKQIIQCN